MRTLVAGATALVLVGCGSVQQSGGGDAAPRSDAPAPRTGDAEAPGKDPRVDEPPSLRVRGAGDWIEVRPFSWCWGNACADGMPPDPLPDLGAVSASTPVLVDLPKGWELWPSWDAMGQECGTRISLEPIVAGTEPVVVPPAGAAGTWGLELFARPPGGGDVIGAVQATMDTDAPVPPPELRLTSFFDHDGTIVRYGPVELRVRYLAVETRDRDLDATLTVESADGRLTTIDLAGAEAGPGDGCVLPGEALLLQEGEGGQPAEVVVEDEIGRPPYRLTVEVRSDGVAHVAEATWPTDVDEEDSAIRLELEPPLPTADPRDLAPDTPAQAPPPPGRETPTG